MDEFINAGTFKGQCILLTINGDAYRVWFDRELYPFIEKIIVDQNSELKVYVDRLRKVK